MSDILLGQNLLRQGKAFACILAGGQGTRLGLDLPKGCYPICPITKKSLFERLCERTKAASLAYGVPLQIAFMTSQDNHEATCDFFKKHNNFGLQENQVAFFQQSSLPLKDEQNNPIKAYAADGNGSFFWNLKRSGLLERLKKTGTEYVTVTVVDNPLADPFDAELIGRCASEQSDVSLRVVQRLNAEENVGVVIEKGDGRVAVIEYTEVSKDVHARFANISYFCFSLAFIEKIASMPIEKMPLHIAKKKMNGFGTVLKSEYFIFDALEFSSKAELLPSDRRRFFAPLKNKEGQDSVQTCQKALIENDRHIFEEITHTSVPQNRTIELSLNFYYPTKALTDTWQGKPVPEHDYISYTD